MPPHRSTRGFVIDEDIFRHAKPIGPVQPPVGPRTAMRIPTQLDQLQDIQKTLYAPQQLQAQANESTNFLADFHRGNLASEFAKRINWAILHFDKNLDAEHEVGVRLVTFGQTVTFHVESVHYHNPSLIIFRGATSDGNRVELIQHVTQLSFLLTAIRKPDPNAPKRKFGFHPPDLASSEAAG